MSTLISKTIANLFNGVSQQAPSLRLSSQATEQVNCVSSIVEGLRTRPGSVAVSSLDVGNSGVAYHLIDRDNSEKYLVAIKDGQIKIDNLQGDPNYQFTETITYPLGAQYLNVSNPDNLKFLTVGDYTYVLNKERTPKMMHAPWLSTDQLETNVTFSNQSASTGNTGPSSVGGLSGLNSNDPSHWVFACRLPRAVTAWTAGGSSIVETNSNILDGTTWQFSYTGYGPGTVGTLREVLNEYQAYYEAGRPGLINLGENLSNISGLQLERANSPRGTWPGLPGTPSLYNSGGVGEVALLISTGGPNYYVSLGIKTVGEYQTMCGSNGYTNEGFRWACAIAFTQGTAGVMGYEIDYADETLFSSAYQLRDEFSRVVDSLIWDMRSLSGFTKTFVNTDSNTTMTTSATGAISGFSSSYDATYPSNVANGLLKQQILPDTPGLKWRITENGTGTVTEVDVTAFAYQPFNPLTVYPSPADLSGFTSAAGVTTNPVYNQVTQPSSSYPSATRTHRLTVNGITYEWVGNNAVTGAELATYYKPMIEDDFPGWTITQTDNVLELVPTGGTVVEVETNAGSVTMPGRTRINRLFIAVKTGQAEQTLKVSIDGQLVTYTTGVSTSPSTYQPTTIASNLATSIDALTGYSAVAYGSFVMVTREDNQAMTFDYSDTWGNQMAKVFSNKVGSFQDLPGRFITGVPIMIDDGDKGINYWVEYVTEAINTSYAGVGSSSSNSVNPDADKLVVRVPQTAVSHSGWTALEAKSGGVWVECADPYAMNRIQPATMPHLLISKGNGQWEFRPADWNDRTVGDDDSVPPPSFIGKPIVDMFFFRNRLGFLTNETYVLSRASQYYNFWPETAKDVLDGDPIDVLVAHTKIVNLHSAVVFNNSMVLFSDTTQFIVTANATLTPKTVMTQPSTEFDAIRVKPVNSGQDVFFLKPRVGSVGIMEYMVSPNQLSNTAIDCTKHLTDYIPNTIKRLTHSNPEETLVLQDSGSNKFWVHKYTWDAEKKVQESISRWEVEPSWNVEYLEFCGSVLYMVCRSLGRLYVSKVSFQPGYKFLNLDSDWRLDNMDLAFSTATYPAPDGWTYKIFQFLHEMPSGGLRIIMSTDGEVILKEGSHFTHTGSGYYMTTQDVTWQEAWDDKEFIMGTLFQSSYEFSPLYFRANEDQVVMGSILKVKSFTTYHEDGSSFELVVTPKARAETRHFVPHAFQPLKIHADRRTVPVLSDGETTSIAIESLTENPTPWFIQSAGYEGHYVIRGRRI